MSCAVADGLRAAFATSAPVSLARFPEESLLLGSGRAYTRNGLAFYQRCERIAGIVQTRFLWRRAYIITEPAAIADVLVNHPNSFIKPYVLRRLKVLFGDGLLTSDGNVWIGHRRLVQPAFSSDRMPAFVDVVRKNAEEMVSSWRNEEVRDVYRDLVDLCMKNIAQTMFGVYDEELGNIVRALAATRHQLVRAVFDVIRPLPLRFPRSLKRRLDKELDDLDKYLGRLIHQRSAEPPRNDFLGLMLSGGGHHPPLSRQAILDELVTILLAGHETTTSALVWGLYLLARHPQQADALAADLVSELNGEAPSHRELNHLESLRATLDETLRLYPPTHRIARTVTTPVVVGGHLLPAGADVVMPQWAVHRSARWYHDPEAFLPSRWTRSFRESLPKFAYFPFSGGSRTCVGGQLAWCESAVILALLTQRFRFSLCDTAPLVPYEGLTMLPASGRLRVKLERRRIKGADQNVQHKSSAFVGWIQPPYTEIW
jgi:cytochrome P450